MSVAGRVVPAATVPTVAITIVCNVIGGAVLVLPTALTHAGMVLGCMLLIFIGAASMLSIYTLVLCVEKTHRFNYKELMTAAFNPRVAWWFEFVLFLYPYGHLMAYSRIIMDSAPPVVEDFFHGDGIWTQEYFWLIIASVAFFILASAKQFVHLRWSSLVGFLTIFYVAMVIVFRFFNGKYRHAGRQELVAADIPWSPDEDFAEAIAVMTVAYSCHFNVPSFYEEMKQRTPAKFVRSLMIAFVAIVVTYFTTAIFGVLTFGRSGILHDEGDIVDAFSEDDVPMNIGRIFLFFHFLSVYPILSIGCRRALNNLLGIANPPSQVICIIESFILTSTSAVLAYFVKSIGDAIAVNGALFGMMIVFTLPGVYYLRIFSPSRDNLPDDRDRPSVVELESTLVNADPSAAVNATIQAETGGGGNTATTLSLDNEEQPFTPVARIPLVYYLSGGIVAFGICGSALAVVVTFNDFATR